MHTRNVALSFLCVAVLQILHNPCCTSTCPSYPPSHHTAPDLALRPMLVGFTSDVATASDSDAGLMALRQTTVQAGPVARTWGQLLQHSSPAAPPTTATAATTGALSHNAVKIAQPQPQPQPQSQSFMALFESARAAIGGSASFGSAASLQQLPLAHRGSSVAAMPTPPPTPCMSPCSLLRDRPDSESSDDDDDGYLEDEEDSSSARYCRPTLDCVVLLAQHSILTHTPFPSLSSFNSDVDDWDDEVTSTCGCVDDADEEGDDRWGTVWCDLLRTSCYGLTALPPRRSAQPKVKTKPQPQPPVQSTVLCGSTQPKDGSQQATSTATTPAPAAAAAAVAVENVCGWEEGWDDASGQRVYFNVFLRKVQWNHPFQVRLRRAPRTHQ